MIVMKNRTRTARGVLCAGAFLAGWTVNSAGVRTVTFTDVNVVTMAEDGLLEGQTVIIRDGVVAEMGPVGQLTAPSEGDVIDGTGSYLMPGLADMHVHLGNPDDYVNYLAHGVTTVMSHGASRSRSIRIREDRDAIRRGETLGPNIIATARILDGDPPTGGG